MCDYRSNHGCNECETPAVVDKTKMRVIFVYGSLLSDLYNHKRFLSTSESFFIGTAKIFGHEMVSLGRYPAITPNDCQEHKTITGEAYLISERLFNIIDSMEIGAGYAQESVPVKITQSNFSNLLPSQQESVFRTLGRKWVGDEDLIHGICYTMNRETIKRYQSTSVLDGDWKGFQNN